MALRFFTVALTPHVRRLQNHVPTYRSHIQTAHYLQNENCNKHFRPLHVRVSDQEAGLQSKREANRRLTPSQINHSDEKPADASSLNLIQTVYNDHKNMKIAKDALVEFGNPDVFGDAKESKIKESESDIQEEEFLRNPQHYKPQTRYSKKLRTKEYARLIKEHLNANCINDALAVLEIRMLREDRVKPENYIYNLLISGCAKAGYTRKAFNLYTKMRQRGLKVTGGTYTSLFNACANAPSPIDGLGKAKQLRVNMLEKNYEPNVKNYNAMIKAYGRCGDVQTAYSLADEMLERQLPVNVETFNFLLQACASDEQNGFRHALLTWHKMIKSGINPDYYSFHTILRCVRDCGIGDLESMKETVEQIAPGAMTTQDLPGNATASNSNELNATSECKLELPNLLLPKPQLGNLVSLSEITRPHERFLLLRGLTGFLELMKQHKVTPNIQCFTTMLEVLPPTNAAEKQLLSFVRKIGLKADIDFFNILIKKRSMRFDYESASEVLTMIRTAGLRPDIVTYGVLALGCRTQEQARELLKQMQAAGIRINSVILGAMLRQGCAQKSFAYVNEIMQLSLEEHIKPNEVFLRHLHNFHRGCARAIDARVMISKIYNENLLHILSLLYSTAPFH